MMGRHRTFVGCLLCVAISCSLYAQAVDQAKAESSAREFVKQFYDWYVATTVNGSLPVGGYPVALKEKSHVFDPVLLRALKEDHASQKRTPGELVGLDFDPFLNTQDPSNLYRVGLVTRKGNHYWVEVSAIPSDTKTSGPDVIAEVVQKKGHWHFVNFHYPGDGDLLSTLKSLREERNKSLE